MKKRINKIIYILYFVSFLLFIIFIRKFFSSKGIDPLNWHEILNNLHWYIFGASLFTIITYLSSSADNKDEDKNEKMKK